MKKSDEKAVDSALGKLGMSAEEMHWKADDAMRTIGKAEEHRKDKPLMREVKKKVQGLAKAVGCEK